MVRRRGMARRHQATPASRRRHRNPRPAGEPRDVSSLDPPYAGGRVKQRRKREIHLSKKSKFSLAAGGLVALLGLARCAIPPDWGANALLHPYRRHATQNPRDVGLGEEDLAVTVAPRVELRGWLVRAKTPPSRGLIVWMHGVADSRGSGVGFAQRYTAEGWDVAAFDARAHGDSGGEFCTYGYYEKYDVPKLLDALASRGVNVTHTVLMGMSMGASVALQAAPDEPRVRGVIAMAPFSTLWLASYER